jgi:hypothetical protein
MAQYIATGCGREYWSRGDGCFPLNYNVKAYGVDLSFNHLWDRYAKEHLPSDVLEEGGLTLERYKDVALNEYNCLDENTLWGWGQEEAYRSLEDCDTYRLLWDGTHPEAVEFRLLGRCGGHLCIQSVNGYSLNVGADALYNMLIDPEQIDMKRLRILYKLARQWEKDFTGEKASAEIEYQAAFQFFVNVVQAAWENKKEETAKHETLVHAVTIVQKYLPPADPVVGIAFSTLRRAAGVLDSEVEG